MEKYNILIIDDDLLTLELYKKIFESENEFVVTTVQRSSEAMEILSSTEPEFDLVISDRMIPGISGDEFIKSIRNAKKPYKGIPIIILSSKDSDEEIVKGMQLGSDYYLTKPIKGKILIACAKNAVRRYRWFRKEIKAAELDNLNKDAFIRFVVASSNCLDYESLIKLLIESFNTFQFGEWEPLQVSVLLKEDGMEIKRSHKTINVNSLESFEQEILEKAMDEYYCEVDNPTSKSSLYVAWAVLWNFTENDEVLSGLSLLVHNYPADNSEDQSELKEIAYIRSEILETVAKLLERVSELVQKLSTQKKLDETFALLKNQLELEKERENIKKIVQFTTQQFENISDENDKNENEQMEIWEEMIKHMQDSFNSSLHCSAKLQPNKQRFLNSLTKLKSIYEKVDINTNLVPGEMTTTNEDKQKDIDDLIQSFGL